MKRYLVELEAEEALRWKAIHAQGVALFAV